MLTPISQRNVVAVRPARASVVVRAVAKPDAPKETMASAFAKVASHAVASAVSAALLVSSVAPSAVQAAVPNQTQGTEVAFDFFGSTKGPTTEAARIGPVETAQRAADQLNNATNNVFGDVQQKAGATFSNATNSSGSAGTPAVTKDALGRDLNPVKPVGPVQEATDRATGSSDMNEIRQSIQSASKRVAALPEENPLDAAKNALGRAKESIKRVANENTATAPGEGPDLQAASDEMMDKFKQKKFEQEGKPQVNRVAQLVAFNSNPVEAVKNVTNQNPLDAAKNVLGDSTDAIKNVADQNPLDAAKNALGRAKDSIKRAANENTATAPGEGPDLQAASDEMMEKFKEKKFEQEGKPQVMKVAFNFWGQTPASDNGRTQADTSRTGASPFDAARNIGNNAPAGSKMQSVGEIGQNAGQDLKNQASQSAQGLQNKASSATSGAQGAFNTVKNKVDDAASNAKGLFNNVTNNTVQDKAEDAASSAKGLFNNVSNSIQNKVNEPAPASSAKGIFNSAKEAATTPVSQRPSLQDAENKAVNSITSGSQNNTDSAASGVKSLLNNVTNAVQNKADDAASGAKGLLNNVTNNTVQGKAQDAASDAKGLFNNVANSTQNKAEDAASSAKGLFNNVTNNSVQDKAQDAASSAKGLFSNVTNSAQNKADDAASSAKGLFNNVTNNTVQDKAQDAASSAKGLFNSVTNSAQNKADDAASDAKGLYNNVKQTAATPVSQRPNLQDAQDSLFPVTGNNSTEGRPEVTKDAFGRDINQMERTSNPAQAIQREVRDASGAAGRALNSANVPTPDSGASSTNLPDVGAALKGLTNKAQDAASNFSANNM